MVDRDFTAERPDRVRAQWGEFAWPYIPRTEAWARTSVGIGRRSFHLIWIGRSPE